MKKMLKWAVVVAVFAAAVFCCAAAMAVSSGTEGNITWSLDDAGVLTISGSGAMKDYTTRNVNGTYITTAPWGAGVTSAVITDGVTSISRFAFYGCSSLTSITIPAGVTGIREDAFYGCSSLTSITIPAGVISIGAYAFNACSSMTSITIPDSVTYIGQMAFQACRSLESIELPCGLTEVRANSFAYCSQLASITIPSSITSIHEDAFKGCKKITDVYYFGSTENWKKLYPSPYLDEYDGGLWDATLHICIPCGYNAYCQFDGRWNGDCEPCVVTISGIGPMYDGRLDLPEATTDIVICDGITSIGSNAFEDYYNLMRITIPDSVTYIGDCAFFGCNLSNIVIPNSVNTIGIASFGNTSLQTVIIPDSVMSIGEDAFIFCSDLREVTILGNVTDIERGTFEDCSLSSVTIPNTVTHIGEDAFNCTTLSHVYFAGTENEWNNIVIDSNNNGLKHAEIVFNYASAHYCGPCLMWSLDYDTNGLTISGNGPMYNYDKSEMPWSEYRNSIETVVIENGVSQIGRSAFSHCTRLNQVTIPQSVTNIGSMAFTGCLNLKRITIPNSVTEIGSFAFRSTGLKKIVIPQSILHIRDNAFADCGYLTDVCYDGTETQWNQIAIETGNNALTDAYIIFDYEYVTGTCGTNLMWIWDSTNTLSISGTGAMSNLGVSTQPWSDFRDRIAAVEIEDGATNISSYAFYQCSNLTSITIPGSVTVIGESAFNGCVSLTHITLPESIETISDNAFSGCSNLVGVSGLVNVTSIGNCAFYNCISLSNISIGNYVTTIGNYAFKGCLSLTDVTLPGNIATIGAYAFNGCTGLATLIFQDRASGECNYGAEINASAFRNCTGLTAVEFPNYVTLIGDYAFSNCSNLANMTFADGVAQRLTDHSLRLGNRAFENDTALTSISLPDRVTIIGDRAFKGCDELTTITIPDSVNSIYDVNAIPTTTTITIPLCSSYAHQWAISEGYTCILLGHRNVITDEFVEPTCIETGSSARMYCGACGEIIVEQEILNALGHNPITDVAVDPSCEETGLTEGSHCDRCGEVLVEQETVPALGHTIVIDSAVSPTDTEPGLTEGSHCAVCGEVLAAQEAIHPLKWDVVRSGSEISIKKYYGSDPDCVIPAIIDGAQVTGIAAGAFRNCSSLVSLVIPDGVTGIGNYAFEGCSSLTSIALPESITSLGSYAFSECGSLQNVTIPNGLTAIASRVFYGCSALERITIPDGVTSIGTFAFSDCISLTSITIPDSVTAIGGCAFQNCTTLNSVTIPYGVTIIVSSTFYNCPGLTSVTLPDSLSSIGNYAFYQCSSLRNLIIPDSVTSIGNYVFYGCTDLTEITVPTCNSYSHQWARTNGFTVTALNHQNIVQDNAVVPTCTSTGLSEGSHCETCGEVLVGQNVLSKLDHTPITDAAVAPTCTDTGLTAGSHCSVCGTMIEAQEIVLALGHDWSDEIKYSWWSNDTKLTASHVCNRDSEHVERETVAVTSEITKQPTCTVKGETTYTSCEFRNAAFSAQVKTQVNIAALGHSWNEPAYTWAEDYTSVTAERVCGRDASHIQHETAGIASVETQPATCTAAGQISYTSASFRNAAFEAQTKVLRIAPLGHTVVIDPGIEPTETRPGLTEGSHCAVCGTVLIEQEALNPLTWGIVVSGDNYVINRYYGTDKNLTIPAELEGHRVVAISGGAFASGHCPTRVYVPETVESIAKNAFAGKPAVYCAMYSEADFWAEENGLTAVYTDNPATGTFFVVSIGNDFRLLRGNTQTIQASVFPTLDEIPTAWSSDHPEIASIDRNGVVTGLLPGTATISYTVGGTTKSIHVTVYGPPDDFSISETEINMASRDTIRLSIAGVTPAGSDIEITWASSDTGKATVDQNGNVRVTRLGDVIITATSQNEIVRSCLIHVRQGVSAINLSDEAVTLAIGDQYQMTADVVSDDAHYINEMVQFSSDNEDVVTVDNHGIVTAHRGGTANITVSATSGVSATVTITVVSILQNPGELSMAAGDVFRIETSDEYAGMRLEFSSSDTDVVTVSANGVIKAIGRGSAAVSVTLPTAGISEMIQIAVTDPMVQTLHSRVDITGVSSIVLGSQIQLSMNFGYNTSGGYPPYSYTFRIYRNGTQIYSKGPEDHDAVGTMNYGTITQNGSYYVGVTVRDQVGQVFTTISKHQITISGSEYTNELVSGADLAVYVQSIDLNVTELSLNKGDTYALECTVLPSNTDFQTVTWTSSNPYVVAVSSDGQITALSSGTATIYAISTDGMNVRGRCTVTVSPQTVIDLPASLSVIESGAFIGLPNVDAIRIPTHVTNIAPDAFDPGITLIVPAGSQWVQWAENNGYGVIEE